MNGHVVSVLVELIEDGLTVHSRTISENEYERSQYQMKCYWSLAHTSCIYSVLVQVYSSAPKLPWNEFLQVLKVFMLGNNQERESDIMTAFNILDQGRRGTFGRNISLSDGLISPDELRAFLSVLTDEVIATFVPKECCGL